MTNFSIGSVLLFVLFITHALVGAVELGTDGWIQNITGNILTPGAGQDPLRLHLAAHVLAALLRRLHREEPEDFAGRPAAASARCWPAIGLQPGQRHRARSSGAMVALAVYALGKTFFWPTMLAVRRRPLPAHRRDRDLHHGRHRHDVRRPDRRPGPRLRQGPFHRRAPHDDRRRRSTSNTRRPTPSTFLFLEEVTGLDGTKLSEAQTASGEDAGAAEPWPMPASSATARR